MNPIEIIRVEDRRNRRRQRVRNQSTRTRGIARAANGAVERQVAPALAECTHQIQHAIDDAPRDVAPERADEHRADVLAAGLGRAERAREREHHDQAEEHFGDAFAGIEHALGPRAGASSREVIPIYRMTTAAPTDQRLPITS
jgi:hypothetical protein